MVVIVDNVEDDYIYEGMTVVENGKTRKIDGDTYTIQSLSSNVTITTNVKKKEKPKPQQQQITGYGVIVNNLSGTTCNYQTRNLPRGKKVVIIYAGKGITGIEVKENGKIKKIDGNTYTIQSLEGVVEVTPIIK